MNLSGLVVQNGMQGESSAHAAPMVPHFPKSARGKRSARKKSEDQQMCAIDLLANLASKLLSERENLLSPNHNIQTSSPVSVRGTVKLDKIDAQKLVKFEACDQLSCNEDLHCHKNSLKGKTNDVCNHAMASQATAPEPTLFAMSEISNEDAIAQEQKLIGKKEKTVHGSYVVSQKCGIKKLDSSTIALHDLKEVKSKATFRAEQMDEKDLYMSSADNRKNYYENFAALVSSDNNFDMPSDMNNIRRKLLIPKLEDHMDPAADKDDENSSECSQYVVATKNSRFQHTGDSHRIRKLLASRLRKVAPAISQDGKNANYDTENKTSLQGKKMDYSRPRTLTNAFRKRKLFDHYSASASDGGIYCEANDECSSTKVSKSCNSSSDYHVKLRIKSFEVPELVVEVPETTTVGSLKRQVWEAITTILGGGLHVGIRLQGKKVTDDSQTLHQAGILHSDKLSDLGFTLEPNIKHVPEELTCSKDPHLLSLGRSPDQLDRFPPIVPSAIDQLGFEATQKCAKASPESGHDSVQSQTNASSPEKQTASSLPLVAVPQPLNEEAMAIVPLPNKPKIKSCQVAQRRVRRPFTVAEVEALVQAVEKLGTGRWRDVKLCAFENEKHRTYVDLKDKWKTLVHTARISPQQRRGEPVPQELLDRVLLAHGYWSQQQTKLQVKSLPASETLLLLSYPRK
ncbi:telomere repeat-binding protein 2-like [Curcuma longa]|uniref:telomere repeat-binding protein 2-like n=1 Tax=Curcuma longa TaxID=136217 RepID=UPI003D9E52AE